MRVAAARASAAALALALACSAGAPAPASSTAPEGAAPAGACAWFGDARGDVLYFGVSSFWSALRESGGDPTAELRAGGARMLGRFDLARARMLPPLALGPADAKSGVWDVLAHPNGWIYFTTFFERAGRVDLASGRVEWFDAAGAGLNELARGPHGRVLATRYRSAGASGSVVVLDERGAVLAEHALGATEGFTVAAKSLAYDPGRDAIWVNTDLLDAAGASPLHDARLLRLSDGRELLRWRAPELQFMAFAEDGTGFLAERSETLLRLRVVPPGAEAPLLVGRQIPLDDDLPASDFAQDIRLAKDGRVLVTRWSGAVHVVSPDGGVVDLQLPRQPGGLYYTAVARGAQVCATYCRGVEVVCREVAR